MAKSRHFRLKYTFSLALILCHAVCSMTPGLSWSKDGKTTYDDLTQSTGTMSSGSSSPLHPPAKRKHPLLESWTGESKKKGSSTLSDVNKFLASEDLEEHFEDQLAPFKPFRNLQGHNKKTGQRDSWGTHDSYDRKRARDPPAQTEIEMVNEMKGALFNWDKKQQDFIEELRRSPPECLTHVLQPSNEEAGKNPQGLLSKRIRDKEQFSTFITTENEAESKRADALQAAISEYKWREVEDYLDNAVLEFHLNDLLPSLPAGNQIFLWEMNDVPVVQLMVRAIRNAIDLRQHIRKTLKIKRKAQKNQEVRTIKEVENYLAEEFVEYSRLLLSILAQASRNYQWDLSDISQLVPKTWFASITSDEKSVISHRITALQKLHSGDIKAAKKHFMEVTKMQAAMNELHRSLHAMGLTTWNLGKDSNYLALKDELTQVQAKWSLPQIENIEASLGKLTTQRIALEEHWKSQADLEMSDPENFLEEAVRKKQHWETKEKYYFDPKPMLEAYIQEEIKAQTYHLEELVQYVFEAFEYELKAKAEILRHHPLQSHYYLQEAYQWQQKVEKKKEVWGDKIFLHFDWAGGPEYVKLKGVEKELSMEAQSSSEKFTS